MSASKIPPLQPGSSRKKKRKYTNWDTQVNMGVPSLKRASPRAAMLAVSMLAANASKKNDAVSSNATPHVPLPACTSSKQSQTPIKSSSYLQSGDCNIVCEYCGSYFWHGERVISFATERPIKYIRCCKGAASDTLAEQSCSGSTLTKQRLCSGQESGESVQQSRTKDKIESGRSESADVQFEVSTEIHNNILPYVNKLRDHRNRGQNAVFFDGQDRLVKVVSFVSSLLDNMKKPILIIASSSALFLWEIEFSKWSKSVNVVTYKGTKDIRAAIRDSEFQVLLSSPDAVVEDMETLVHIKWELLVIDECQRLMIPMHLKKIQMLMADMKLLTVSGEPVDILQSYRNILSLVDCINENINTDADVAMNDDISILNERLSPFIAFQCNLKRTQKETSVVKVLGENVQQSSTKDKIESSSNECKFGTTDLEEYWVPIHLSSMQIKQYCSILASNSSTLASLSRTSSLNDVITQIQKCCDHPYLVDPTLRNSSKEASLIHVSGKLHVFDKILLEIKRCGLRALVLFHSTVNSEKMSTGRYLDDLVRQRFGENSYVYIPWWTLSRSGYVKKEEALEMFNKAESDRFVCLCDHLACLSNLRLSRVDVVILFNSDRNPSNDIKSLKRITIDSHRERLIVFRLYSAFTVEEKSLILSKQGTTVDSFISSSVCHQLLAWGATYLFRKLRSGTNSGPQSFINDLVCELSSLLTNTSVKTGPVNRSIIANARMQTGGYSGSILLFGETETHLKESSSIDEYLIDNRHSVFWSNLVNKSQPVPERSCSSSSSTLADESCSGSTELEVSTELHNHVLPYVIKLLDHRNRSQNAVFFDGQDRLVKVVSFVSSLLDNVKKPILIIASSSARLLWEIEFLKWSKLIKVVTYKGTKDIRAAIRGSEFQVLLSSPDAIVEDMETLEHIKWELLVIDECQCPAISTHLKKIKMLMADMKLLTVSGEPVDILQSYRNILSLVDCKNETIHTDADMEMSNDIGILKERLSPFIAFECNLKRTQTETSSVKVLQIPASALFGSKNPYLTSGHSLAGSGLRPAPHLRSSTSMFAPFRNQPASCEPSLEPLPNLSATQTVDK
ncbi:putative DNA helicase chromatin remodeling SNF2 family [Helianthus annuus]|nr:chromodomain-helicase-DNA-binding protein 3 isoform X2 [Helianthus annuus]XP_021985663.1 chromodomain-helicase-DNA-binding protein 3 isoform X2 [Helianthus annuus]XP_021985666.1 chromodomain-helicase-DNA-binding protein 3 isoform X2 [Helianthus annuus]XP_021985670.1 chromodomain-helicase-DNA-binding protein 3 isoform X2 [Helianthus annuus]XP_035831465.1 chromodomain-helicase-DNA-binding protein 3 isoform X2 [Helianthus annuus]XP_035831469.1 chromodomain-helicase-DNA-binding protein 3 isofor